MPGPFGTCSRIRPRPRRSRPAPAPRWEAAGAAAAGAPRSLALLDITGVRAVVLPVVRDPMCLPAAAFPAADVILTEDTAAGAPLVRRAAGPARARQET